VPLNFPAQRVAPLQVDIPIDEPAHGAAVDAQESLLPAARTLQPESVLDDATLSDSMLQDLDAVAGGDPELEEARNILMRALRAEAPLSGSLIMLKVRRARTRAELAVLVDDVEARIIKPYRSLAAQQTIRRVRQLLAPSADSNLPRG
jgi:hypothetical protein